MNKFERTHEFLGSLGALFKDDKKVVELRNVSIVRCNQYKISSGMLPVLLTSESEITFDPIDGQVYHQLNDTFTDTCRIPQYSLLAYGKIEGGLSKSAKVSDFYFKSSSGGKGHPAIYSNPQ